MTKKIADDAADYVWGDEMTPQLRQRLIDDAVTSMENDPELSQYDRAALQDMSDGQLFLRWLRS